MSRRTAFAPKDVRMLAIKPARAIRLSSSRSCFAVMRSAVANSPVLAVRILRIWT